MAFSVAGLARRFWMTSSRTFTLIWLCLGFLIAMATTERLSRPALLWAIPLTIIVDWIVCAVVEQIEEWYFGLDDEPDFDDSIATPVDQPRYTINHGYVLDCVWKGENITVQLPLAITPLMVGQSAIPKDLVQEGAKGSFAPTPVEAKDAPRSLVTLYRGNTMLGFGARVRTGLDEDLVLTASHVALAGPNSIAHGGKRVGQEDGYKVVYPCTDYRIDFAFLVVPAKHYAILGVSTSTLGILTRSVPVAVYGGLSSTNLMCSIGFASQGDDCWQIQHNATTQKGWSGTPLYYKGVVVGVHTGHRVSMPYNHASNPAAYFKTLKRNIEVESPEYDEASPRQLSQDEYDSMLESNAVFNEYNVDGDTIKVSGRNWHKEVTEAAIAAGTQRKPGLWADWADLEIETLATKLVPKLKSLLTGIGGLPDRSGPDGSECSSSTDTVTLCEYLDFPPSVPPSEDPRQPADLVQETASQIPLNCQGADLLRDSPPLEGLLNSEGTDGKSPSISMPAQECPSSELECRIASLEKQLGRVLDLLSSKLSPHSPNSQSTDGQTEAPKPNVEASSTKHHASDERYRHPNSKKPSETSKQSTPVPQSAAASKQSPGSSKTSTKKSRGSRKKQAN